MRTFKVIFIVFAITLIFYFAQEMFGTSRSGILVAQNAPQEPQGRIDISSENSAFELVDIKSSGQIVKSFGANEPATRWIIKNVATDSWKKMTLSFVPAATGNVIITLRGAWFDNLGANHRSIIFDDVSLGKTRLIKNGGFEIEENGLPKDWSGKPEIYIKNKKIARSGKHAVQVWHDVFIEQAIPVKAWKTYTINAYFKKAKE